jgi:hypothetical protein
MASWDEREAMKEHVPRRAEGEGGGNIRSRRVMEGAAARHMETLLQLG